MKVTRTSYERDTTSSRRRRMKWWTESRFGMFIHWGLYSQLGRHEWVWARENMSRSDYVKLADTFRPPPRAPRQWARLARSAGMKYMILTAKHHDGYCLWDTQQSDFNAVQLAPGRDIVREYVDACREYGLRVGIYYSLKDWYHPDGERCVRSEKARRRFLDFTQGCLRELMSNYGRIDVLWYDSAQPLQGPKAWESVKMNAMIRDHQPHIIINDRSDLPEDYAVSEEMIEPSPEGRSWESCMTFNGRSWGYMPAAARDAFDARTIVKHLHMCASRGGNFLLNIGPAPDGSVPEESVQPLRETGKWLNKNGEAVYGKQDREPGRSGSVAGWNTRKDKIMYFWCMYWMGPELLIAGFPAKLKKASLLANGKPIKFRQEPNDRLILTGLPKKDPGGETGITVIKLEYETRPRFRHWKAR